MIGQGFFNSNVKVILGLLLVDAPPSPNGLFFLEQAKSIERLGYKIPSETSKYQVSLEPLEQKAFMLSCLYETHKVVAYDDLCHIFCQVMIEAIEDHDGILVRTLIQNDLTTHHRPFFRGENYVTKAHYLIEMFNWIRNDVCEPTHCSKMVFDTKVSKQEIIVLYRQARGIE